MIADAIARISASPAVTVVAAASVIGWAVCGAVLGWSDDWHRPGDIIMTAVPFVVVFSIQSVQRRDTAAIQAKLDELVRATAGARDAMVRIEDADEECIERERV